MNSPPDRGSGFQSHFLAQPMGPLGIVLFGLFFIFVAVLTVQLLVGIWPGQEGPLRILWIVVDQQFDANANTRLLLVAVFSGALGSFIHAATSFTVYLGNRQLNRSWAGWYLLRPFVGMALAVIFYFLIRAGFVAPSVEEGTALSPFGIAAVSGLAGMFSKEATDKLQQFFKDLLKPPEEAERLRGDKLNPAGTTRGGGTEAEG